MARLGDICLLVNGYAFKPSDWSQSGLPIIRIQNLNDVNASFNYYDKEPESKYLVHNGDLLFSWSGTPGTSFGAFFWNRGEAVLNQHIFNVYPSETVKKEYLRYALNGKINRIIEKAHGGVGLQHITKKELVEIEIPVLSIEEQNKVVSILDKVNDLIEKRKQQLEKLDMLVKSQFIEMFGDIPKAQYQTIKDVCHIVTDGTHQPPKFVSEGIPFLLVSNIANNEVTYETSKFITEETYNELIKRTPIEIGDILLSTVGSYGHPAIVKCDKKFCFQRHIAYLKPNTEIIDSVFLYATILSHEVQSQIDNLVLGVAQKTLNLSAIRRIEIPVPPMEQQKRFCKVFQQADKSKFAIQKSMTKLETLKKALMQKYFG